MRLIISYDVSDGYTYSATVTEPIIADSAEAALVELDEATQEYLRKQALYLDAHENLKYPVKASDAAHKAYFEQRNAVEAMKPLDEIDFHGCKISFQNMFYIPEGQNKPVINLPSIMTLDEFFLEVEKPKNKPGKP